MNNAYLEMVNKTKRNTQAHVNLTEMYFLMKQHNGLLYAYIII